MMDKKKAVYSIINNTWNVGKEYFDNDVKSVKEYTQILEKANGYLTETRNTGNENEVKLCRAMINAMLDYIDEEIKKGELNG